MGGPPADGLKGKERGEGGGQVEYIHASHIQIHQSSCGSVWDFWGILIHLSLVVRIIVVLKTKTSSLMILLYMLYIFLICVMVIII